VIDSFEEAVTVPSALTIACGGTGAQPPGESSTAEPPDVPPILPFVNPPVALNVAEMFASSCSCGVAPWPDARPAIDPPSYTALKCYWVLPIRNVP